MKKAVFLIVLSVFFIMGVYAEEQQINSGSKFKIKQTGNKVKINVTPFLNQESVYSDVVHDENSNPKAVTQNCSGNVDVLHVQNVSDKHIRFNNYKAEKVLQTALAVTLDPYAVKINGQKYYMVRDRGNNKYSVKDILGYDDSKADLFDDLKKLNSDNDDTKITPAELKKAGIRFVSVMNNKLLLNDKTKDYNLDNIRYIDLTTLRGTINNGKIGSFGYFDMYINENNKTRKIIGFVTFDSDKTLNEMIAE